MKARRIDGQVIDIQTGQQLTGKALESITITWADMKGGIGVRFDDWLFECVLVRLSPIDPVNSSRNHQAINSLKEFLDYNVRVKQQRVEILESRIAVLSEVPADRFDARAFEQALSLKEADLQKVKLELEQFKSWRDLITSQF
jgi:uncharacterized protein (UPF0335 family)